MGPIILEIEVKIYHEQIRKSAKKGGDSHA